MIHSHTFITQPSLSKTLTCLTLTSTLSIALGIPVSAQARIQFNTPDDSAPTNTTGGGIRGNIQFHSPEDAAPETSTGGGIRGNVQFLSPGDTPPEQTTGGGIRGDVSFLPPGDPSPQTSIASGTRGTALTEIVPLLPPAQYGHTISAHPTLLVYIPPTPQPQTVFFSVQDENRQNLYQTTLELSGKGGIISLSIPETAPELEVGKTYTWFFSPISPEGFLRPDNYGVVGWVKRVEPSPEMETASTPMEQAVTYAASGVWYDTLNVIASAQQAQPDNPVIAQEWQDLLEQVGLEKVASQPLTASF